MKSLIAGLAIAITCTLLADDLSAQGGDSWRREIARNRWMTDYGDARELARETGKPLLVVFRCDP